jgi:NAD(P)-dependent dehydrogenase (short-subunit alcohol dehydrogenase family)
MELRDRVAVITGGKRIGRAVAAALAAGGADLVLGYRGSKPEADETADAVRRAGRRAAVVAADVSRPADCQALVRAAVDTFGRLDVLVNMASIYRPVDFDALTADEWEANIGINLSAAFHCSHAAAPLMRHAGGGRIVNFADWLAASGRPQYRGFAAYYVAKAGVIALTEALALELAPDHILVNAIAPGPIVAPPGLSAEELNEVAAATPVGRWGGEEEVVKTVLFLIASDFVTGETIRLDGGRHLR